VNDLSFVYRVFVKGLLALLPIFITAYLLVWIAQGLESAFGAPVRSYFPFWLNFPGAGIVLAMILIFLFGLLVDNYLTQKFFDWMERRLETTPVIRSIYGPIRDVTQLFAKKDQGDSQRVVFVRPEGFGGIEILGLMTRDDFSELPKDSVPPDSVVVFIPFSYAMGGYSLIVPKSQVRDASIPAEKALQLALTAWIKNNKT
jgi:uncharacterized membrane protein